MNTPAEITNEITSTANFWPAFDSSGLSYDPELGFCVDGNSTVALGAISLLGFGVPIAREGGMDTRTFVEPITSLDDLPHNARTISLQGKGVGPRLYNTPNAVLGLPDAADAIGVYTVNLVRKRLLDKRGEQGSAVDQVARHAGRVIRAHWSGLDKVVDDIHHSYGDCDAVLLGQPPLPTLRQWRRHASDSSGAPAGFIIIRSPDTTLTRVGTAKPQSRIR